MGFCDTIATPVELPQLVKSLGNISYLHLVGGVNPVYWNSWSGTIHFLGLTETKMDMIELINVMARLVCIAYITSPVSLM